MSYPIRPPLPPMEAFTSPELPEGGEWLYEPKWDGFRCLVFRDGASVKLQSRASKDLTRYFPEVVEKVRSLPSKRFVLDGELIVSQANRNDFDLLLQRIHPATSRVERLSRETPAHLVVFDLLAEGSRKYLDRPLGERRTALEKFAAKNFRRRAMISLSPATRSFAEVKRWARKAGSALDGVIAKQLEKEYRPGRRDGMQKLKFKKTADCVVGGYRSGKRGGIGSLLLGLYDGSGKLHHVGFTSSLSREERSRILSQLRSLSAEASFTGAAPGGPSRWNRGKESQWFPVEPRLVCEVEYDHFTRNRFRHGTKFLRWRPDKAARKCTFEQVRTENNAALLEIVQ